MKESPYFKQYRLLAYLQYLDAPFIERDADWSVRVTSNSSLALELGMQNYRVRRAFEDLVKLGLASDLSFGYNCISCKLKPTLFNGGDHD